MTEHLKFIEIIIKTSHLFANCDGKYSENEDNFIKGYINTLCTNHVLDSYSKENYLGISSSNIDDLVSEIKAFLSPFNEIEQTKIKETLITFAENVIQADGFIDESEQELYDKFIKLIN